MTIFDDIYGPCYDYLSYIFEEKVTYHSEGNTPRVVSAIVDREVPAVTDEGIPVRLITVTVKNSLSGIRSQDVKNSTDYFMLEKRRGEEPKRVSVMNVEDSASGVTVISCR